MKRRTILQLGVLVLLGMGVLFSLMTFDQAGRRDPELLEVSVIIREADNTGWSAARQGMEQAAADLGAELRFLTLSEPDSVEEQRSLLAREVEGGADAVVLVPADAQALGPDVARAAAGAAVVTMESDLAASGAKACITVDNAALGTALAKQILRDIPQGSGVLLVDLTPGNTGVGLRLDAAARVLEEGGCPVYRRTPAPGQTLAELLNEALPAQNPGAVAAFEPTALELTARALQNVENAPPLYGMGATSTIASYLERGGISLIAAQNEFAAGYLALQAAVGAARGEALTNIAPMEFSLIRRQEMYEVENEKLLFPVTR